jgi:hypothetical protein
MADNSELAALVRELFGFLDTVEVSDAGREFYPTRVQTSRKTDALKLDLLLHRLKQASRQDLSEMLQPPDHAADHAALFPALHPPAQLWECFCDEAYYGMWAVRKVEETRWGHCYHLNSALEAQALTDMLNRNQVKE